MHQKTRKSKAGRKPYDVVLMFKVLVLQHFYNLADEQTEYQIRDRYSFCRFLGLTPEGNVPDARTIWLFRKRPGNPGYSAYRSGAGIFRSSGAPSARLRVAQRL